MHQFDPVWYQYTYDWTGSIVCRGVIDMVMISLQKQRELPQTFSLPERVTSKYKYKYKLYKDLVTTSQPGKALTALVWYC